jgi:hypothetical protein
MGSERLSNLNNVEIFSSYLTGNTMSPLQINAV